VTKYLIPRQKAADPKAGGRQRIAQASKRSLGVVCHLFTMSSKRLTADLSLKLCSSPTVEAIGFETRVNYQKH
jgi:hypothetical protein